MRRSRGPGLAPAALAVAGFVGCAGGLQDASDGPAAGEGAARTACLNAVAAHVGGSTGLEIARLGEGPDGGAAYEVRDRVGVGDRLHVCEVDAGGRVTALLHPGA